MTGHQIIVVIVMVAALGVAAQWVARRLKLPLPRRDDLYFARDRREKVDAQGAKD